MTVFEDGTEKALLFEYNVWTSIKAGDILIKQKNELNFTLVSGIDTLYFNENIPDCEQFKE